MKTHLITLAVPHEDGVDLSEATQLAARAVEGSHVVSSETVEADLFEAEWDDGAPALPMTAKDALTLMDEAGYISVVVAIEQDKLLSARSVHDKEEADSLYELPFEFDDHHDVLHELAFDFGYPASANATIVAVQGEQLLVLYSTLIQEAFAD